MTSGPERPPAHRLFLALVPDTTATEVLERWLTVPANGPLPTGWRTTEPSTWHVTLAFMASVPADVEPRLIPALARVARHARPLPLAWGHPGAFPHPGAARVAWIALEDAAIPGSDTYASPAPTPADAIVTVGALAGACRRALRGAGADPDRADFRAHLTLGRTGRPRDISGYLTLPGAPAGRAWTADRMVLVESQLGKGPGGRPRYVERAGWRLGQPAEDALDTSGTAATPRAGEDRAPDGPSPADYRAEDD